MVGPRNIWEFQRGYHVYAAGHTSNDQFNAFQLCAAWQAGLSAVAEENGSKHETISKG